MKTTLDLDDELLVRAKTLAVRQRTSLTHLIEEGLELRLRAQEELSRTKTGTSTIQIHEGEGGLAEGLDALSNKALLEAADS